MRARSPKDKAAPLNQKTKTSAQLWDTGVSNKKKFIKWMVLFTVFCFYPLSEKVVTICFFKGRKERCSQMNSICMFDTLSSRDSLIKLLVYYLWSTNEIFPYRGRYFLFIRIKKCFIYQRFFFLITYIVPTTFNTQQLSQQSVSLWKWHSKSLIHCNFRFYKPEIYFHDQDSIYIMSIL